MHSIWKRANAILIPKSNPVKDINKDLRPMHFFDLQSVPHASITRHIQPGPTISRSIRFRICCSSNSVDFRLRPSILIGSSKFLETCKYNGIFMKIQVSRSIRNPD